MTTVAAMKSRRVRAAKLEKNFTFARVYDPDHDGSVTYHLYLKVGDSKRQLSQTLTFKNMLADNRRFAAFTIKAAFRALLTFRNDHG